MYLDKKLTANFDLYEFIEASPLPNQRFLKMNWENINEFSIKNAINLALCLQRIRDHINHKFKDRIKGELGIKITSAFRCVAWEKYRGRSGEGAHPKTLAVDFAVVNIDKSDIDKEVFVMRYLYKIMQLVHPGGLAIKKHTVRRGKITRKGFLHYDILVSPPFRRWSY